MQNDSFSILNQCLLLAEQDRVVAARNLWNTLSEDFRVRFMRYVLVLINNPREIDFTATIRTPYGELEISNDFVSRARTALPRILNVSVS
jgi:hypothetical protein